MNWGGESGVDPNKEVNKEAGSSSWVYLGKAEELQFGTCRLLQTTGKSKETKGVSFRGVLGGNWEEQEFKVEGSHWPHVVVNAVAGAGSHHVFKSRRRNSNMKNTLPC